MDLSDLELDDSDVPLGGLPRSSVGTLAQRSPSQLVSESTSLPAKTHEMQVPEQAPSRLPGTSMHSALQEHVRVLACLTAPLRLHTLCMHKSFVSACSPRHYSCHAIVDNVAALEAKRCHQ